MDPNQVPPNVVQTPVSIPPPPQQSVYVQTSNPNPVNITKYASFWVRLTAFVIDVVVMLFLIMIIIFPLSKLGLLGQATQAGPVNVIYGSSSGTSVNGQTGGISSLIADIVFLLVVLGYGTVAIASAGATLGKKAVGIKVIDKEGNKPNVLKAFLRSLSKFILAPFIFGFLVAAFSEKKQGLHDMIAGTYVVAYSSRGKAVSLAILATLVILIGIAIIQLATLFAFFFSFISQFKPH